MRSSPSLPAAVLACLASGAMAAEPVGTGSAASEAEGWRYTAFADGSFSRTINRQAPQNYRSESRNLSAGLTIRPHPALMFGVGIIASDIETRFRTGVGAASTDFQAAYASIVVTGFGFVNLTAAGGFGWSDTSVVRQGAPLIPGAISGYDGHSRFASLGLNAMLPVAPFLIVPSARLGWARGHSGGFVDSLGFSGLPFVDSAVQAEIGAQIFYGFTLGPLAIAPYAGAYYQHELDLPASVRQRGAGSLVGGASVIWRDLIVTFEGRTTIGRSDYESHRLRGSVSYKF